MVVSLTLDSNILTTLPEDMKRLILLQELSAKCNRFEVFPSVLFDISVLAVLDLSFNSISYLPGGNGWRNFKSLRDLHLSNNSIIALPDEMGLLSSLESLHVEGNVLKKLPDLGGLRQLRTLIAYDNKIQVAPRNLPQSLEVIDLSRNDLTSLSGSNVCIISSLVTLDLSSNRLTELPRFRSPNLEELAVADNRLESLSPLEDLPQLRVLDASRNALRLLPYSIGALSQLTEVHLRNNSLETLPPSLGMCQNLRMLDVSDNKLETIPEEIGLIPSLTNLKFRHNSLTWVPAALSQLPHLQELDLFNNRRIGNLPEEMTRNEETPARAVLRYLSTLVGEKPQHDQQLQQQEEHMEEVVMLATPNSSYRTPRIPRASREDDVVVEQLDIAQEAPFVEEEVQEVPEEQQQPIATSMDESTSNPWDWMPQWLIPASAGALAAGTVVLVALLFQNGRRSRRM